MFVSKTIAPTRRQFVAGLAAAAAVLAVPGLGVASESAKTEDAKAEEAAERTITDMAGREVTIPTHPTKVMGAANPDGTIIYTINPKLLTGWTSVPSDDAKKYLDADAAALPQITSVSKWEDPNKEEILSMDPDFILVAVDLDNTDFALYNDLTDEIGVPVVVVDAELSHLGDSYRFMATIFDDDAEQCTKLADFIDKVFEDVDKTMEKIPEDERVRTLYSTGDDGLQTCGDSNWNGQFLTPAGGINVCDTDQTSGFANVSMEQVLSWAPDVIISSAKGDKAAIYGAEEWKDVPAVAAGEIYAAPQLPFSWIDKPTGVNRVVGVKWTNSVLYPDAVEYDIKADVIEFYQLFYHYEMTEDEAAEMLDTKVAL